MKAVIKWIKGEPVVLATSSAGVVTLLVALGIGQSEAGAIGAAVTVVAGMIARTQTRAAATSMPATSRDKPLR